MPNTGVKQNEEVTVTLEGTVIATRHDGHYEIQLKGTGANHDIVVIGSYPTAHKPGAVVPTLKVGDTVSVKVNSNNVGDEGAHGQILFG